MGFGGVSLDSLEEYAEVCVYIHAFWCSEEPNHPKFLLDLCPINMESLSLGSHSAGPQLSVL